MSHNTKIYTLKEVVNQFANLESDDGDDSGEDVQSNDSDEDFEMNHSDNDERAIADAENEDEEELEVENPWTCQDYSVLLFFFVQFYPVFQFLNG